MDRQQLRLTLLDVLEQETWERPQNLADDVKIREELKLDSVDLLSVMLRVETQLQISLNSRDFEKVVTVGDLLDVIQGKLTETAVKNVQSILTDCDSVPLKVDGIVGPKTWEALYA